MKKDKTAAEIGPTKTYDEWREYILKRDEAMIPRQQQAKELGISKYTLRIIAESVGIKYKPGRRKQQIHFKKDN